MCLTGGKLCAWIEVIASAKTRLAHDADKITRFIEHFLLGTFALCLGRTRKDYRALGVPLESTCTRLGRNSFGQKMLANRMPATCIAHEVKTCSQFDAKGV